MLVLTRRKNESIVIDDNIVVTIIGVRGDRVRVGVRAAKDIGVYREEIWKVIQEEKKEKRGNND